MIAADVPTTSQITEASRVFLLRAGAGAGLRYPARAAGGRAVRGRDEAPRVGIEPMNADVTDAAYRLARLFDQPGRWRCWGRSAAGAALLAVAECPWPYPGAGRRRQPFGADPSVQVAMLRRDLCSQSASTRRADAAGMSVSVFHRHFRVMTTLSPLQFQKQLRLDPRPPLRCWREGRVLRRRPGRWAISAP